MPDHFHLISNPKDGRIKEFIGSLKSISAKRILSTSDQSRFGADPEGHHVWQQSFKAIPLWSGWMIWQKINYIHANPVKAGIVGSAEEFHGRVFDRFIREVIHRWLWIETGAGTMMRKSYPAPQNRCHVAFQARVEAGASPPS